MKNKFLDGLPAPVHSVDLLRGLGIPGSLPTVDISFQLTPQFSITTLLVAGHLLETRFNHWLWKNLDVEVASLSLGAAFRKVFYQWESHTREPVSAWCGTDMDEVAKIGTFIRRHTYTRGADPKFRRPGLNTSFWEAAILGPVPGTTAHVVLTAQNPGTKAVGGTVISVRAEWFAKIRSSDMFGKQLFEPPYNDFPFPQQNVDALHLTEREQLVAFAGKELPRFELIHLQFGRIYMSSSFRALIRVFPNFPSGGGIIGGEFQAKFLASESREIVSKHTEGVPNDQPNSGNTRDNTRKLFILEGWYPMEAPPRGEIVDVALGIDCGFRAFSEALRAAGRLVELDEIIDVAKAQGWDGKSSVDLWNLGFLCRQFELDMILEINESECYRFPGFEGHVQIRLVCTGQNRVGWVRGPSETLIKQRKVKFSDSSDSV